MVSIIYSSLDVNGVGHENAKGINHFFAKWVWSLISPAYKATTLIKFHIIVLSACYRDLAIKIAMIIWNCGLCWKNNFFMLKDYVCLIN